MDDVVSPYFGGADPKCSTESSHSCSDEVPSCGKRLGKSFFDKECTTLAKELLGQVLARKVNGVILRGMIVETESYLGGNDVASHSYNGKRTPRNEPMYMAPGTLYVYSIYGMYYCLNVSSQGEGSCVLIRSLEPVDGIDEMIAHRSVKRTSKSKPLKEHELCNGPSKLCLAMNISKDLCNKVDATISEEIWLEEGQSIPEGDIVIAKRIGIESAGHEWANKPLRYYVFKNKNVSVKDKKAEASLSE
ncbi:uncharacterized protein LOC135202526 [Macrobrachium nipponense]|uniref:uncharacterized protein LOC135202526 n=1 Tax=Macrobrachium nipponense TaxID=159736 RepID=UPI0030C8184B